MKNLYIAIILSLANFTFAQVTDMGGPLSWNGKTEPLNLDEFEVMAGYDQDAIDAEDEINDVKGEAPWRFGYKYETDYTQENSGKWTDLPSGGRMWQIGITCEDAQTVNFIFEDFYLPEGAYIYLYDVDRTNRVGAYTSRNNRIDGLLGTELVHGQSVIVEYFEPASVVGEGHFTIANVVHGYRSLNRIQEELMRGLNDSGNCNVDVNCPLGDDWDPQIRSVAMIVVGGSGICTGALINNTCNDGTPYFLTANHCLGGSTGTWAFRFNWESPPGTESCATTTGSVDPGAPYDQTANGATVLESGAIADFALLQIDLMTVADAEAWNCFYAGWDNSDDPTENDFAIGIHHPSGDLKKICKENEVPYHATASGADVWWIDDWDEGVTEPGSSGSPLFNQEGRIIGQLYGGAAACTGGGSGTDDNDAYDYYGRFGVSWVNGVSDWLAPASCGSATTNDGWDPNAPTDPDDAGISGINSPDGLLCSDEFIPEVVLRNYGSNDLTSVTINYDVDGGAPSTFAWTGTLTPGSTEVVTLPSFTTTGGVHTFNASTSDPNGTTDSNTANDANNSSFSVTIGGVLTILTINTDCWGEETAWEIYDDGGTLVESGGNLTIIPGGGGTADDADPGAYADETTITQNFCFAPGCYDFIIYDDYGDGLYGSQWGGCSVDGDYSITDGSGTVLAEIMATDSDFGDSETNNFCVTAPCSGTASSSTLEEACFDDCDGEITISMTGGTAPFTYDIGAGPVSSPTFTGLCQGSHDFIIEDGDGCSTLYTVVLDGPAEVDPNATVNDISCNGETDGEIVAVGSGGTSPYTFGIDGGALGGSGTFSGLSAGTYTITVSDDNGCTNDVDYTVNEPAPISASYTSTPSSGSDGSIDLTVSGGTAPFTFAWTGPSGYTSTDEDPTGLAPGNYTVTITDANGCTFDLTNVNVTSNLSTNEFDDLGGILIFPNPSSGVINIQLTNYDASTSFEVLDITGRAIIANSYFENQIATVDLSNFADGVYYFRITQNSEIRTFSVVLQK